MNEGKHQVIIKLKTQYLVIYGESWYYFNTRAQAMAWAMKEILG